MLRLRLGLGWGCGPFGDLYCHQYRGMKVSRYWDWGCVALRVSSPCEFAHDYCNAKPGKKVEKMAFIAPSETITLYPTLHKQASTISMLLLCDIYNNPWRCPYTLHYHELLFTSWCSTLMYSLAIRLSIYPYNLPEAIIKHQKYYTFGLFIHITSTINK